MSDKTSDKTGSTDGKKEGKKGSSRRGHRDGSIYKRASDGRWVAVLTTTGGARKYLYGASRGEVREKLQAAQHDLQRGLPLASTRQTVGAFLGEWIEIRRVELDAATEHRYRQHLRAYLIPGLGHVKLAHLSAQQVERLYADLLARGLGAGTVRGIHGVLHQALEYALRHDLVPRNVSSLATLPRLTRPEMHPLSAEQARAFLAAMAGERDGAFYVVAIYTGLRIGELLGLRWRDVHLEGAHPSLRVQWQLKDAYTRAADRRADQRGERSPRRDDGLGDASRWIFAPPKTKRSRRLIRLAPAVVAALRAQRKRLAEERLALGAAWHDYDLVFPDPLGRPRARWNVYHRFQTDLKRAGLPRMRVHDLRHTCATILLAGRVNPKVVSELLGHATVAMTLDIYSHVLPDMQQDAVDAMEALLTTAPRVAERSTQDAQ